MAKINPDKMKGDQLRDRARIWNLRHSGLKVEELRLSVREEMQRREALKAPKEPAPVGGHVGEEEATPSPASVVTQELLPVSQPGQRAQPEAAQETRVSEQPAEPAPQPEVAEPKPVAVEETPVTVVIGPLEKVVETPKPKSVDEEAREAAATLRGEPVQEVPTGPVAPSESGEEPKAVFLDEIVRGLEQRLVHIDEVLGRLTWALTEKASGKELVDVRAELARLSNSLREIDQFTKHLENSTPTVLKVKEMIKFATEQLEKELPDMIAGVILRLIVEEADRELAEAERAGETTTKPEEPEKVEEKPPAQPAPEPTKPQVVQPSVSQTTPEREEGHQVVEGVVVDESAHGEGESNGQPRRLFTIPILGIDVYDR